MTDELRKKGYTTFLALADAFGFKEPAPNAMLTIFAPTNEVRSGLVSAVAVGAAAARLMRWTAATAVCQTHAAVPTSGTPVLELAH